jgi:hypothetical protein
LIQLQSGWSWNLIVKFLVHIFDLHPAVEEDFEHWPSAQLLGESAAENKCHLCALIWNTMNIEQQRKLIADDQRLQRELEQGISSAGNDNVLIKEIQHRYHRMRSIKIKLLSPWAQRKWSRIWEVKSIDYSMRLIPHFGYRQVAQRWMLRKKFDLAVSFDEDPTMSWHKEQVDPIEVLATREYNTRVHSSSNHT